MWTCLAWRDRRAALAAIVAQSAFSLQRSCRPDHIIPELRAGQRRGAAALRLPAAPGVPPYRTTQLRSGAHAKTEAGGSGAAISTPTWPSRRQSCDVARRVVDAQG